MQRPAIPQRRAPSTGPSSARENLTRALPWLERRVARSASGRLAEMREDLLQGTVTAALARIAAEFKRSGRTPAWCQDAVHLRRYLAGVERRTRLRLLRDSPAWRELSLESDIVVEDAPQSEPCRDLQRFLAHDLRWFLPDGGGALHDDSGENSGENSGEGSSVLECTPEARAKRRARAVQRLRARCQTCRERQANGCTFAPLIQAP